MVIFQFRQPQGGLRLTISQLLLSINQGKDACPQCACFYLSNTDAILLGRGRTDWELVLSSQGNAFSRLPSFVFSFYPNAILSLVKAMLYPFAALPEDFPHFLFFFVFLSQLKGEWVNTDRFFVSVNRRKKL